MTVVRATASLPDLPAGQEADVDPADPLWANRIRTGLVVTITEPEPEPPATVPDPDPPPAAMQSVWDPVGETFEDAVESMTVEQVLAKVRSGQWDPDDVLAAEQAGKARSSLLAALDV